MTLRLSWGESDLASGFQALIPEPVLTSEQDKERGMKHHPGSSPGTSNQLARLSVSPFVKWANQTPAMPASLVIRTGR